MKNYSYLQAIFMSFFSGDLYRDVAKQWTGVGILYFMLVFALTWTVTVLGVCVPLNGVLSGFAKDFAGQCPHIKFADGKLSVQEKTPYAIKDTSGTTILVLDPQFTKSKLDENDPPLVATADKLLQQDSAGNTYELMTWDQLPPGEFDANALNQTIDLLKVSIPLGIVFLAGPFYLIGSFIQVLIGAVCALIISSATGAGLDFGAGMRVSAVAATPGLVVGALLIVAQQAQWYWLTSIIGFVLMLGYVIYGVMAASKSTPEAPLNPPLASA